MTYKVEDHSWIAHPAMLAAPNSMEKLLISRRADIEVIGEIHDVSEYYAFIRLDGLYYLLECPYTNPCGEWWVVVGAVSIEAAHHIFFHGIPMQQHAKLTELLGREYTQDRDSIDLPLKPFKA